MRPFDRRSSLGRPSALLCQLLVVVGAGGCVAAPEAEYALEADAGAPEDPRDVDGASDGAAPGRPERPLDPALDGVDEGGSGEPQDPPAPGAMAPNPPSDDGRCAAACAGRPAVPEAEHTCVGSLDECLELCATTSTWMPPFQETAAACLVDGFVWCGYESLATCALRGSPSQGVHLKVELKATGLEGLDSKVVWVSQDLRNLGAPAHVEEEPVAAEVRDGAVALAIPTWLAPYGSSLAVWIDVDGDGRCGLGDVATSVWVNLDDRPHWVPPTADHPLATGVLRAALSPEEVFYGLLRRVDDAAIRCPDSR